MRQAHPCVAALLLAIGAMMIDGCRHDEPAPLTDVTALLDERAPWADHERPISVPRHPAEQFLHGWVIALDPGHGGDAHLPNYKRGPTGVREAEVNLRVALLLARLLEDAGVHVVLTRTDDSEVSLQQRAHIANTCPRPDGGQGADLFISIHHNAADDPRINYSSVWFHGQSAWSEPDLDVARYLAHRLGAELRTDIGYTSPLMSDQQMYASGFGVLRRCHMPAVLCESSFHSNPEEEQRLRDPLYNLREAYAIYLGLCEYAYGGRPTQSMPTVQLSDSEWTITTTLDDGLPKRWWGAQRDRTIPSTIALMLDGQRLQFRYDPASKLVEASLPAAALSPGRHILEVHHANFFKHHNFPQRYALVITQDSQGAAQLGGPVQPLPPQRSGPDPESAPHPDQAAPPATTPSR